MQINVKFLYEKSKYFNNATSVNSTGLTMDGVEDWDFINQFQAMFARWRQTSKGLQGSR